MVVITGLILVKKDGVFRVVVEGMHDAWMHDQLVGTKCGNEESMM